MLGLRQLELHLKRGSASKTTRLELSLYLRILRKRKFANNTDFEHFFSFLL
jgi:hypothetical protein